MRQLGLLFVINEPPSDVEEELNAWYDTEHIPERLSIEGFLSASRQASIKGPRRYLALYDLADIGVLQSPGYMAFVGEHFTPWTKRILSRTKVSRFEAVQTYPGDAVLIDAPHYLVLRWAGLGADALLAIEAAAKSCFLGEPNVNQLRVFAGSGNDAGCAFVIVTGEGDLEALFDPEAFKNVAGRSPVVESYTRMN